MRPIKRPGLIAAVIGICLLAGGFFYLNPLLPIITGYPAKYLCSAVFVSGREPAEAEASNLDFSFIRFARNTVDYEEKSVTSRFLWGRSKAIYREGFGCTLLRGADETELRKEIYPQIVPDYLPDREPWPLGNVIPDADTGADRETLRLISERLIIENGYGGNPFAFMVLHRGHPVAEMYKPAFGPDTRFLSWSMAKSLIHAVAGTLVLDGQLDAGERAGIEAWQYDGRRNIAWNDLMQMQSGLEWNEDYGNRSDVTVMLYCEPDFAAFTYEKPSETGPGMLWKYSSGTTNIVSRLIVDRLGSSEAFYRHLQKRIFIPLGMPDALLEPDNAGTPAGSSYWYATARDYARFGLLYLQDGVFNGRRILPEGWSRYAATPAEHSGGRYGAFFWLNRSGDYPSAPEDMYLCQGYNGQKIFIIPSKELVVVILGYSPKSHPVNFDKMLADVIGACRISAKDK